MLRILNKIKLLLCSAGLIVRSKIKRGKSMSSEDTFNELYKTIQDKDFSNILTMGSQQRIDDFQYPGKMRKMQKLAVKIFLQVISRGKRLASY